MITSIRNIDWSKIPSYFDWVAADDDGNIHAFPVEPIPVQFTSFGIWGWSDLHAGIDRLRGALVEEGYQPGTHEYEARIKTLSESYSVGYDPDVSNRVIDWRDTCVSRKDRL